LRLLTLAVPSNGANAPITVLRLDPNLVRLRVGYAPGAPRALSQWQADSGALAVINGGFFSPEFTALGVTVSGGQAQGESLAFGGMFAVDVNGAVSLRNLADQPYDGSEPLQEALQSFPILVRAPGEPAQIRENGERNRRTVVALDEAGRVLLIVAPTPAWTLQDMGRQRPRRDYRAQSRRRLLYRHACCERCRSVAAACLFHAATGAPGRATVNDVAGNGCNNTLSDVPEHGRKNDHDNRCPDGKDRQIIRLPAFKHRERPAPTQKADVEHGRPQQVD
jgi:hypothetical protein